MSSLKPEDSVLPDGSICPPSLLEKRYSRPFAQGNKGDGQWAAGGGFWTDGDVRTPTERDRARLRYSNVLYRLGGVTQVISPPTSTDFFHNRLAHSLKVSDLAGAIASDQARKARANTKAARDLLKVINNLGGLDVAACEAAGLAHDLGHPPFGHVAEHVIDHWLRGGAVGEERCANGFEGNAQAFRAVTRLSLRTDDAVGLELSAVTLAAILKYPWLREVGSVKKEGKFGAYHSEGQFLDRAREWFLTPAHDELTQTLEASIMDLADDITYAVHDLQDFITAKIVPVSDVNSSLKLAQNYVDGDLDAETDPPSPDVRKFLKLMDRLKEFYPGHFSLKEFSEGLEKARGTIGLFDASASDVMREATMRNLGSRLIAGFMRQIVVSDTPGWPHGPHLYLLGEEWHHVQILKEITKAYVVDSPAVGLHQESETSSLTMLLENLENWVRRALKADTTSQLPKDLQQALISSNKPGRFSNRDADKRDYRDDPVSRAIVDYICSLTDRGAYRLSQFLRGNEIARIVA
jgi:dGTPase